MNKITLFETNRGITKQNAKMRTRELYVLKITNVNRINPYLKNLLLNSPLKQRLSMIIKLSNQLFIETL